MSTAETELLVDYVASGSQRAFSEIVSRHVDLVFSAAQRQVRCPQLAEEVTQNVFVALARNAHRLKPDTPLVAWLYLVTRRACIDALRAETRRKVREKTAMEMSHNNSRVPDWSSIEPLLDTAMERLGERDRAAILLRYFEDKSLREVGAVLGMSEDAAQKRVSRAVEQMRAFFSRQGVTVGAGSIASMMTTQAVQAAPIGLGLSISATAALSGAVAAGGAATLFVMTTLQKTLLATTMLGLGLAVYEYRVISGQAEKLVVMDRELAHARAQMGKLREDRDTASARWSALQSEIDAASTGLGRPQRSAPPIAQPQRRK
jgi:RNA polymerase sigma factor (sigma-70 family)